MPSQERPVQSFKYGVVKCVQQIYSFRIAVSPCHVLLFVIVLSGFLSSMFHLKDSQPEFPSTTREEGIRDCECRKVIGCPPSPGGIDAGVLGGKTLSEPTGVTKYLVIYSGPTSKKKAGGTSDVYDANFEFFLNFGLHHNVPNRTEVDFVFVLTNESLPDWKPLLLGLKMKNVHVLVRRPECYDMQSYIVTLEAFDYKNYDRIIALNCGLRGPFIPPYMRGLIPWTVMLGNLIDEEVKLAGLSQNQATVRPDAYQRHIQSMMWVTDPVGLSVIISAGCMFDCTKAIPGRVFNRKYLIERYEIGMSVAIKRANYSLRAWNNFQIGKQYCDDYLPIREHNRRTYPHGPEFNDEWYPNRYFATASPYETMFIKYTRGLKYRNDDMDQKRPGKIGQCSKEKQQRNQAFYRSWYAKYVQPAH